MEVNGAGTVCGNGYGHIEVGATTSHVEAYTGYGKWSAASASTASSAIDLDFHIEVSKDHAACIPQSPVACICPIAGRRLQVDGDVHALPGINVAA